MLYYFNNQQQNLLSGLHVKARELITISTEVVIFLIFLQFLSNGWAACDGCGCLPDGKDCLLK